MVREHCVPGSSLYNFLGEYRRPARLFFPCRLVQHISKNIARLLGGGRARHNAVSCQSEHPTRFIFDFRLQTSRKIPNMFKILGMLVGNSMVGHFLTIDVEYC